MKGLKACLLSGLWFTLSLLFPAKAQVVNSYNINKYSGLPSDMAYSACIDHLGYLWLCTNNGVARYNGYELKTFNVTDGLPSNDVWGLYPDKKNRLWLRMISNRIGYIAGRRYHNVHLQHIRQTLYPQHISEYAQGIFFITEDIAPKARLNQVLCLERNDTLRFSPFYFHDADEAHTNQVADRVDSLVNIYEIRPDGSPRLQGRCAWKPSPESSVLLLRDQYVAFGSGRPTIEALNINTCRVRELSFRDDTRPDPVHFVDHYGGFIYVIAHRSVYKLDSALNIVRRIPVQLLTDEAAGLSGERINNFFEDSFWGRCVTTRDRGVYLHYGTEQNLSPLRDIDLSGYACIGHAGDSLSYWWDQQSGTLTCIGENGEHYSKRLRLPSPVRKLVPFNENRSFLLLDNGIYWFHHRTQSITPLRTKTIDDMRFIKNIVTVDTARQYMSSWSLYDVQHKKEKTTARIIDKNRYYHLEYDSLRRICWAYNSNQLLIHRTRTDSNIFIHDDLLKKYGISSIEKIITHGPSGNIFLKDYAFLYQADFRRRTLTRLFPNYNLKEALFYIHDDKIILAGTFGILFSRINGLNDFSAPVVCPNIKHCQYHQVQDAGLLRRQVILKTDKRTYLLGIPGDSVFRHNSGMQVPHRIILEYADSCYALQSGQTIQVMPDKHTLQLDLINPRGNGRVTYRYTLTGMDTGWHELGSNVLQLPPLEVDRSYSLSIIAGDEVWKSDPVTVTLYLVPRWWQTRSWQTVLWLCGTLLLLGILFAVVLLTRHFVARANGRKQRMATLELKAIHAQINPHFIFNTLNAALYFIKKRKLDDAVAHVTRFSHLLRAYLESSRNRHIRLADEITNLRNYAELQQTRFSHRFAYKIVTDNRLPVYQVTIPSLLLQPVVENAIHHGLAPMRGGGMLTISFTAGPGERGITCIVDDNGIGRQRSGTRSRNDVMKKESYGSQLIRELIDILNKQEQMGIEIIYLDKEPPLSGTRVTILINNPRYES